jgi:hypothetical protein
VRTPPADAGLHTARHLVDPHDAEGEQIERGGQDAERAKPGHQLGDLPKRRRLHLRITPPVGVVSCLILRHPTTFVEDAPGRVHNQVITAATKTVARDDYLPYEGFVQFQDYGDGAAGGGKNDDYLIVGDSCPNGDGVKAWAWVDGVAKGSMYNGNGAYTNKIWDPLGNLKDGASLGMKICSVSGNNGTPYHCNSITFTIHE